MPEISIIVPVYKVEKYINRCIKSILDQTYPEFELILIDDGSPDNSGKICDEYKEKDKRIVVIHQENKGQARARNAGIEWALRNSQSNWITFIDSDDWIHKNYLQCLYSSAVTHNCKISVCNFKRVKNDDVGLTELTDSVVLSASDLYKSNYYVVQSPCCKLYHKSLFMDGAFRFPEGILYEDSAIVYRFLFLQKQIVFCPSDLYYYFHNGESSTGNEWNPRQMVYCEVLREQLCWLEEHGYNECVKECVLHFLESLHYYEYQIHDTAEYYDYAREMRKTSRRLLKKYRKKYDISIRDYPSLFETGYPHIMSLYWFIVAQYQKIKRWSI